MVWSEWVRREHVKIRKAKIRNDLCVLRTLECSSLRCKFSTNYRIPKEMGREGLREKDAHWLYGRYWLNMLRHKTPAHTYLLFISFNVSLSPFFFFLFLFLWKFCWLFMCPFCSYQKKAAKLTQECTASANEVE